MKGRASPACGPNGKFRDELLNEEIFCTLKEAEMLMAEALQDASPTQLALLPRQNNLTRGSYNLPDGPP